ncbi:ATPase [Theobroma cacao]|nr:ATPase [Theobroma cacao]
MVTMCFGIIHVKEKNIIQRLAKLENVVISCMVLQELSLLINLSRKSIFVIEDIDCSLNIAGKRKIKKEDSDSDSNDEHKSKSKVTSSEFLNFVDGIWSACSGERIIVFTTNHVDKLDPALIRRGRMDMHIELSYCTLGEFKVLAKNYLNLDSHPLFEKIGNLLEEVNMTPAEVSEHLICGRVGRDPKACLESLIEALETAKEKKINEEEKDAKEKGGIKSIMPARKRRPMRRKKMLKQKEE